MQHVRALHNNMSWISWVWNRVFCMMKMVLCDKSEIAAIHYVKRGEIYFLFPMKGSLFDTTNTHAGLKKRLRERNRGRARESCCVKQHRECVCFTMHRCALYEHLWPSSVCVFCSQCLAKKDCWRKFYFA